jgi:hypothetical protein
MIFDWLVQGAGAGDAAMKRVNWFWLCNVYGRQCALQRLQHWRGVGSQLVVQGHWGRRGRGGEVLVVLKVLLVCAEALGVSGLWLPGFVDSTGGGGGAAQGAVASAWKVEAMDLGRGNES